MITDDTIDKVKVTCLGFVSSEMGKRRVGRKGVI